MTGLICETKNYYAPHTFIPYHAFYSVGDAKMVSVSDDAEKFIENTQNDDNYEKWSNNTQANIDGDLGRTAAEGLAARYDEVSEADLSSYSEKQIRNTQAAIDDDRYEDQVEELTEDDWSEKFLAGITGGA